MGEITTRSSMHDVPDTELPTAVRQYRVRDLVESRGFVTVRELAERFAVSTVTVRNDLDLLVQQSAIQRVHGGAMAPERPQVERTFEEVSTSHATEKDAIGRAAADLVKSGEAITLDVGTTMMAFATRLAERNDLVDVTVFTNGLNIALALESAYPRITVVVSGGTLRPKQHSLVNPMASEMFDGLRAASAFLGCNGVDVVKGCTNMNLAEAEVKRSMAKGAARRVVLADASKLGVTTLAPVMSCDELDVLVTDHRADERIVGELRTFGVDVVVAE
ncbi:MAG: DeoR/GlpR family DNA-binding transcription regulator [Ilumatobacter sp.]|jgi:DeoR family transcriptional regulator, aga operon transcriptional repressor|uniref:DeoR/GlpR family DNA-binding transcription regulator n=1 Tax=Ilumatobacter sp. TaxID=1967498 RepID=UPI00391DD23D